MTLPARTRNDLQALPRCQRSPRNKLRLSLRRSGKVCLSRSRLLKDSGRVLKLRIVWLGVVRLSMVRLYMVNPGLHQQRTAQPGLEQVTRSRNPFGVASHGHQAVGPEHEQAVLRFEAQARHTSVPQAVEGIREPQDCSQKNCWAALLGRQRVQIFVTRMRQRATMKTRDHGGLLEFFRRPTQWRRQPLQQPGRNFVVSTLAFDQPHIMGECRQQQNPPQPNFMPFAQVPYNAFWGDSSAQTALEQYVAANCP